MQTRHLTHLPPVTDVAVLASALETNVGRFFRKNGKPMAVSWPEITGPGEGWASATEAQLLDQLRATCMSHGVKLRAAVPAAIALAAATADRAGTWMEHDIRIDASYTAERRLAHLKLTKITDMLTPVQPWQPTIRSELRVSGMPQPMSIAVVAAFGATLESTSDPLAIRVASGIQQAEFSLRRLLIAAIVLLMGIVAMLIAPIAGTHRAAAAARVRLRTTVNEERAARWTSAELSRTTAALSELAGFSRHRRSAVLVLESIARALREDVSLQSIRFDDLGGSLVVLSSDAAEVLAELDSVRQITGPKIVGAVAPEMLNGERLERVTIRFQWKGEPLAAPARTLWQGVP